MPIENLQAFYQKYYQPDNVVLIVAGKFDEAKALDFVQKYFGAIPQPQRKLDATYTEEPPQDGERRHAAARRRRRRSSARAYHIPAGTHEDAAPLELLANILSTQPSGRLYKRWSKPRKPRAPLPTAAASTIRGFFLPRRSSRPGDLDRAFATR